MIKFSHGTWIFFSGLVWMAVGVSLLALGLRLIVSGIEMDSVPLLSLLSPYVGSMEYAAIVLIAFSMGIGYLKGNFVLQKTVARVVKRIRSLPNPAPITQVYGLAYCMLIAVMVLLGLSMRYFGFSYDIRGTVDVAVGAALIQGAMRYFRNIRPQTSTSPE